MNVDARCTLCDTPLGTPNDRKIGGKYYCVEHYEKMKERNINSLKLSENKKIRKFFGAYDGS